MTSQRYVSSIIQSLSVMMAIWLISCTNSSVITDEILNDGDTDMASIIGKIVMHQTGGFAGVSRTITIGEKDGSIYVVSMDEKIHQRSEGLVSPKDLDKLWQTLDANDVFTLPTNQKLLENVADGFFYEITVQRKGESHQFVVYAPEQLAESGETRYDAIVEAIRGFADSQLKGAQQFITADLPINDISVELLESFPLQVHVVVNGYLPDGCTTLNEIMQQREGNTIRVHITTKRPKDEICIQVIKNVQERISLEGAFLPGRYKVIVNGTEKEFQI